jgi:DNA-binding MarR family transcriptional regulator
MQTTRRSAAPSALDADQLSGAVRVLVRLQRLLERAEAGLTLPQYRVLALVALGDERSARLAERLAVRKPTMTAVVDGLVAAGHLRRVAIPGDRRGLRLSLTPQGLAALSRADDAFRARLEPVLLDTPDPERLLGLLLDLGRALDARHRAAMASGRHG